MRLSLRHTPRRILPDSMSDNTHLLEQLATVAWKRVTCAGGEACAVAVADDYVVFTYQRHRRNHLCMAHNGNPRLLYSSHRPLGELALCPTGQLAVTLGDKDLEEICDVALGSIAGGAPRAVTNDGRSWGVSFTPDGSEVAFVSRREGGTPQVYVMSADGTNQRRVTLSSSRPPGSSPEFSCCQWPSYSGDGAYLAYTCSCDVHGGAPDTYEIYVAPRNSPQAAERATHTGGMHMWRPPTFVGSSLFFSCLTGRHPLSTTVFRLDVAPSCLQPLHSAEAETRFVAFLASGVVIVQEMEKEQRDRCFPEFHLVAVDIATDARAILPLPPGEPRRIAASPSGLHLVCISGVVGAAEVYEAHIGSQ